MDDVKYYNAIAEILKAGHRMTEDISRILKPFNMTEPQYNVLRILEDADGEALTVQLIQEQMYRKSSNVSRIIDKLLDKGLVNRETCKENRRKVEITLTEHGNESLVLYNEVVHKYHEPLKARMSDSDCETLLHLLNKLQGVN